jgi:hypothetical protein
MESSLDPAIAEQTNKRKYLVPIYFLGWQSSLQLQNKGKKR